MKRLLIPSVVFVSLALIVLSGWLGYASVNWSPSINLPLAAASPTPNAQTRTVVVTRSDVRQVLTVPGSVTASRQQKMGFTANGKLMEVTIRAGDTITKGQTLARLDTEPLKLALAQHSLSCVSDNSSIIKARLCSNRPHPSSRGSLTRSAATSSIIDHILKGESG
jgi:multidrug efflux pump subunit AcrA (membrane-fusion protein)